MSRSYKTVMGYCDRNPFMKRYANRRVRHINSIPSGGAYRKVTCSWNICDWTWIWHSRQEVIDLYTAYPFYYTQKEIQKEISKLRRK